MADMTLQESVVEAVEYFTNRLLDATNRVIRKRIEKTTGRILDTHSCNKELITADINGLIICVGTTSGEGARLYKPNGAYEPWRISA